MKTLIDLVCPTCGRTALDVWVLHVGTENMPACACGTPMVRNWAFVKSPGVTPQGTRPERNTDQAKPEKVNTAAIARETQVEIEQKWLRYGNEQLAEQHVSREINHAAGMADEAGNVKPIVKPAPIEFANPMSPAAATAAM